MVTSVMEHDFADIVQQSFNKLDIAEMGNITVKNMRQGLLVNLQQFTTSSSLKKLNRSVYKRIEPMSSKEKVSRD